MIVGDIEVVDDLYYRLVCNTKAPMGLVVMTMGNYRHKEHILETEDKEGLGGRVLFLYDDKLAFRTWSKGENYLDRDTIRKEGVLRVYEYMTKVLSMAYGYRLSLYIVGGGVDDEFLCDVKEFMRDVRVDEVEPDEYEVIRNVTAISREREKLLDGGWEMRFGHTYAVFLERDGEVYGLVRLRKPLEDGRCYVFQYGDYDWREVYTEAVLRRLADRIKRIRGWR